MVHPNTKKARKLRRKQTNTEKLLWSRLRDRQLCGLRFKRQQAVGPFIVDFYCPEKNLVIELDGGHHNTEKKRKYDEQRTGYLKDQDLKVIRFWNNQINKNISEVLDIIAKSI